LLAALPIPKSEIRDPKFLQPVAPKSENLKFRTPVRQFEIASILSYTGPAEGPSLNAAPNPQSAMRMVCPYWQTTANANYFHWGKLMPILRQMPN
jgi:hypothetical protein